MIDTEPVRALDFNPIHRDFVADTPAVDRFLFWARELLSGAQPYVLGVDLSHWNTSVDWHQLRMSGYEFAILKATESLTYVDPTFHQRWKDALSEGFILGSYHFFRSNQDGALQADHHLKTIAPMLDETGGSVIPPCDDVETTDGVTVAVRVPRVLAWNNRVWSVMNRRPLCYTSPYMWSTLMGNAQMDCVSFTAHWTSLAAPLWPAGHPVDGRLFWQFGVYPKYSWALPAPTGVVGECDLIRFFGTRDQLCDFTHCSDVPLERKVDLLWAAHPELH
jgi:hypothetical protein